MRDEIEIKYTDCDLTTSASKASNNSFTFNKDNGVKVKNFFEAKDNSAWLLLKLTTAGSIILRSGDCYPTQNVMGDLEFDLDVGEHFLQIERLARFENKDGSLNIDFANAVGTINAIGKRAGLKPIA